MFSISQYWIEISDVTLFIYAICSMTRDWSDGQLTIVPDATQATCDSSDDTNRATRSVLTLPPGLISIGP